LHRCYGWRIPRISLQPQSPRLRLSPSTHTLGQPPGVVSPSSMAPPSVDYTVGCQYGCGLGPIWCRLLQVPPVSSLASSPLVSTLDSVHHPPPEPPSKFPSLSPFVVVDGARTRLTGSGRNVSTMECFVLSFDRCVPREP
ncbi:hypothetical protein M9458_046871, partial [Cirrhinus mrigala]